MRFFVVIGSLALALLGCNSDDADGGGACNVSMPSECPPDMPTYEDVEPIFAERCVGCHGGDDCSTCWSLESYRDIMHWKPELQNVMLECRMPPPESGKTMSNTERMELLEWLRCGAPE